MGNGNSKSSKSKVQHGQRAKVGSSELLEHDVPREKTEPEVMVGFPTNEGSLRLKGHSEEEQQHGKESSSLSLDNDDTFTEFIRHVKYKAIRSFSNIGFEQSKPAPEPEQETHKKKENQNDEFDDFIKVAKKKLKTTSRVGKSSFFRD